MKLPIFSSDMIFIHPDIEEKNREGVIQFLCSKMVEKGYVTDQYYEQVINREIIHPTGLPTLPFASAVAHADPIGVNCTGIALAVLREPVVFNAMDNPKQELQVSLVFLMAFIKGDQIAVLRWISNILSNQVFVKEIAESKNPASAFQIIEPLLLKNLQ
jgi:PTS system galactitol-specific IIA component